MAHQSVTAEKAASVLHRSARTAEITVAALAARIVESTRRKAEPDPDRPRG